MADSVTGGSIRNTVSIPALYPHNGGKPRSIGAAERFGLSALAPAGMHSPNFDHCHCGIHFMTNFKRHIYNDVICSGRDLYKPVRYSQVRSAIYNDRLCAYSFATLVMYLTLVCSLL
jgi:hypothetical protein